jgi:type I restriction enzyme S subunit
MNAMPSGWANAMLGELAHAVRGLTYKKNQARSSADGGHVPLLRATNVQDGELLLDRQLLYLPATLVRDDQWLQPGDIVVASSSGSSSVVGKSAPVRRPWHGTFGAFCTVLRPSRALDAAYISYFLASPTVRDRWSRLAAGTNINNLKTAHVAETPVPVPPLNEQRRIVAAIDEQFSRLEAAELGLRHAQSRVDILRSSVITSLVEGDWPRARWKEVGRSQNGRAFPSQDYAKDGVKLLRPGNLHASGRVVWDEENTRRLPHHYEEEFLSYVVGPRELVMNLTAQSLKDEFLGRICLTGPDEHCLLNQRLARLTPSELDASYLLYVFKARPFRRFVDSLNKGSLIQHMFTAQLDDFEVPIPPLDVQRQMVEGVERQISIIEDLVTKLEMGLLRVATLRHSILNRAFGGTLVAQDPADEPASVLLERIAADRAATATPPRGKTKART